MADQPRQLDHALVEQRGHFGIVGQVFEAGLAGEQRAPALAGLHAVQELGPGRRSRSCPRTSAQDFTEQRASLASERPSGVIAKAPVGFLDADSDRT